MKCKKVLLLLSCALLLLSHARSQNAFGFKAGMQLVKMTGFEDVPNSLLPTLQLKGIAILPVGDDVTINPSIGYSGKGYKWNDVEFTDQFGTPLGTGDVIALFHYVQLAAPLSYRIAPNQNQEYHFGVGPYFSYAVSGKGRIKNVAISTDDNTWDLFTDDAYKKTDAGIVVEIASQLKKKFLFAFNVDIGLADVSNQGGGKLKHLGGGISLGYLFSK